MHPYKSPPTMLARLKTLVLGSIAASAFFWLALTLHNPGPGTQHYPEQEARQVRPAALTKKSALRCEPVMRMCTARDLETEIGGYD